MRGCRGPDHQRVVCVSEQAVLRRARRPDVEESVDRRRHRFATAARDAERPCGYDAWRNAAACTYLKRCARAAFDAPAVYCNRGECALVAGDKQGATSNDVVLEGA